MPKKFAGENTKAVQARNRKAEAQRAANEKKQKELEDAYWRDDDKHVNRKIQRKESRDKKKLEQNERKNVNRTLLEEEEKVLEATVVPKLPAKVTRAQIQELHEKRQTAEKGREEDNEDDDLPPLVENLNRIVLAEDSARNVDEAINLLSGPASFDRHPEKRMKAAYKKYADDNLPRLKAENPTLRLAQVKQLLNKEWLKSPDNPLNQKHKVYNEK